MLPVICGSPAARAATMFSRALWACNAEAPGCPLLASAMRRLASSVSGPSTARGAAKSGALWARPIWPPQAKHRPSNGKILGTLKVSHFGDVPVAMN